MTHTVIFKAVADLLAKIIPPLIGRRRASDDPEIIRFVTTCFKRPAFRTRFDKEDSEEDLIQAIEDTITALNTGKLKDRKDGSLLAESKPIHFISNPAWRKTLAQVELRLQDIRSLYRDAEETGKFRSFLHNGHYFWPEKDLGIAGEIDQIRQGILTNINIICQQAGLPKVF